MPRRALVPTCLALLAAALMLAHTGAYAQAGLASPSRDAGVFLYVGQVAGQGQLPYRDAWDHKGPLLYGIEALGLWLGRGHAEGVLALEIAAVVAATLMGYRLLARWAGPAAALFGSLLWLLALPRLLEGGNYTEEFALPLQFAALSLCAAETDAGQLRRAALAGALVGLTLLLQPNLIAIPLIALALVIKVHIRLQVNTNTANGRMPQIPFYMHAIRRFVAFVLINESTILLAAAGVAAPLLLVGGYFAARGGLADLWDAYIGYNLAYATAAPRARALTLAYGLALMVEGGLAPAALAGYVRLLRDGDAAPLAPSTSRLLLLCAAPLDLLLTTLSGRLYLHYYITWLPGLAMLAAAWAAGVFAPQDAARQGKRTERRERIERLRHSWVLAVGLLALAAGSAYVALFGPATVEAAASRDARAERRRAAVDYVAAHTAPGDTVLVWGAETALNFLTQRPAPTRYSYQYPLFKPGYTSDARARALLLDLAAQPPALIVDAAVDAAGGAIPPLDATARNRWAADYADTGPAEMAAVYAYIAAHYRPTTTIGEDAWVIYRRVESTLIPETGHDGQPAAGR